MKKLSFFIASLWLSLTAMAQSVKVTGPGIICTSTFATFDCDPQNISGTVTNIQWTIPNANYIAGAPSSNNSNNRSVTVQFTATGIFTVSVAYTYTNASNKSITLNSSKSVTIIDCPSTDCQGTKASAPFLLEDFGTLPADSAREPLPPPGYTSYQYLYSGPVNDGQYIISDNTNNGRPEWVTTGDHTGNPNGNMMIVNASYQPDTFYTRVVTGLCGGVQYSFSAWLLNVDSKQVLQSTCAGGNIFPNVAFKVLDAKTGFTLGQTFTHDVSMKLKNDVNGNPIDDPTWQPYGFGFKTPVGVDSIKLLMYNIAPGGCGNDIAIDDINFTYCGPELKAYFGEPGIAGDTICAGKPDTIFSYVTPGYFINPTYQWQKSKDEVNWTNILGATNPNYIFPVTDTSDSYYYRFLAAEQGNIGKSTCNSASNDVVLLVLRSPYVNPGDTLICYGGTATLNAQPGYDSYLWSTGATTSSISVSPTVTTKYYVTATLSSGAAGSCTDTDSSLVTVFNPDLFTLPADTGMCTGDTVLLNANPLNLAYANLTYKWSTGETTPSIRVTKTGQYSVIISNGVCASVYDTVQVNVHALPVVNLGNDTSVCSGQSVTLDAGNVGSTFLWNTGATTQTINANTSGNYHVTVTNSFGCAASGIRNITVNPLPIVSLGNDTSVCSGQSVTLDAGNAGSTFLWNTGATTRTINANTSGNYSVTVTNAFGCAASGTRKLTVNPLPIVSLGNDTSVCSGQSVTLDAGNAGSSFLWNTGATTQTINANASGSYNVTVTNSFGCSASSTRNLTVNPLPVVSLGNDTAVCSGQIVTLNASNAGDTFLWNTGATTQTINANTSGNYHVTVTNTFGCAASGARKLTVNPLPVVSLGNDTSVCSGQSVTLDAGNVGSTFLWNTGQTTQTINANTSGSYSVAVTNAYGCTASGARNLTVNPLPIVNLGNDTSICSGQSVTLDAGNAGSTFLWNTGATTQTINANASGNYHVTVTNAFGCTASGARNLTVNPLPIVNLGNDTSVCSGQSVTLDAGNAGSTFLWNTAATTQTISANTSGNYNVTVTNAFGCAASGARNLTVNPLPIVNLGNDTSICAGQSVTLDAGNTGSTFLWNTGATTQTINANTSGNYNVIVTNSFGCAASGARNLTVNPLPIISLGNDTSVCAGQSVTLDAGNAGSTFLWNTGATTQTINANASGNYHVTVTNSFGCAASGTRNLTVNPLPIVNLGNDTSFCAGQSITLDAGNAGDTFLWNTGATTQTINANASGSYNVTVTNSYGCSASGTRKLTVNPLPIVSLGNDTSVCSGQSITLNAGNAGSTFLWNTGQTTQTINANASGNYNVMVTNSFGCAASGTRKLAVNPLPIVSLGNDTLICSGQSVTLDAGNAGSTFLWNTGATTQTINANASGSYNVTVTNAYGCTASGARKLTVNPLPVINLGNDTSVCSGQSVTLNAQNAGSTFLWNTGQTTQTINANASGNYNVTVTNAFGCTASGARRLTVNPLPIVSLGNDTSICSGQSVTLDAGNAGSGYLWNTGATTQTINANTSGNYNVTVTNSFGCAASGTRNLTVNPLPVINLGNDTSICSGQSVTLDAGNAGSTFLWNTGATTQTINANASEDYHVTVTNTFGCAASGARNLTVNPLPIVNLGNDTAVCSGQIVTLNAGNVGSTFLWNTGQTTQTINANTSGNYNVTVTNAFGCIASGTRKLTVNPLPIVSLGNDTSVCSGQSVTLDAGNAGSMFLWNTGATTQTINASTSGNYHVTVTNSFGCVASGARKLTVNPLPVINLGNDTSVCSGQSVTLNAQNAGSTFLWNTGQTTQTINANASGNYNVTVTNAFGCTASGARRLTVNPLPIVSLGNDTSICSGQSVTLDAGNAGSGYLWNTGATTQTINANTSGNYNVTVTNSFGCAASGTRNLTVNPLPVVNLGNDTAVCAGQSVTLNAQNAGSTFLWNTGQTTQTINVSTSGNYHVTVTNAFGCAASGTRKLTVNPLPIVDLGNDTSVCSGQSVTLDAGNAGSGYLWNTGATTQTINANTSGNYHVTVTNGFGCTASGARKLTVNPLPIVSLGNDTSVCSGQSVTLNAQNAGSTFLWNTGATTQTINANTSGNYNVTVTNSFGCAASGTRNLTVNPLPVINLGNDTSVCSGQSVTLDAGNVGSTFLWNTGATTQTINANTSWSYHVTVTNTFGCAASGARNLTVNPLPIVSLGNDTSVCSGQSVTLDAGNAGSGYLWNTGQTTQTINASTSGNYHVTVTNAFGCAASGSRNLTVNPLPIVNLGNGTSVCSGQTVTLNAGNAGSTFLWNTGATTQTINANASGSYNVTVTNVFGCSASGARNLTVNPLPIVNLGNDTSVCSGQSVTLDAGNAGSMFLWNTGATTQTINANTSGNYHVTVANSFGCTTLGARKLTVNPLPIVSLGNDTSVCSGQSIMLNAQNAGSTFLWNTGQTTQTINANASGNYNVTVTNSFGCSASGTRNLTVNPLPVVSLGNDTSVCSGQSVTLDAGNAGSSFLWNTGQATQTINANASGNYHVTVTNVFGCTASGARRLAVNPLPIVNLGNDASVCSGQSVTLDAGNAGSTFLWNTGQISQKINADSPGTYFVNVTNSFGCIASGKLGLKVYPLPDIALTKDTSVCSGQSVILDAGNAGSSFLWSTGSTQQSIQAFIQGQYWVNVKSQFGCEKSDTVQLHINPLPRLSLNRQAGLCEGSKVQLKPEVESTDYAYQWNDGSTEPTLNVSEPGAYWVIVSNGLCLTIDTTEVVLLKNKLPAINDFQTLCPNTTIQLSAYSTEAAAYQWNTGETGNSIQVNKQGVYTVQVRGRYCNYSRNDTIRVQTGQLPAVHIVADDTSICEGDRIRLLAIGNDVGGYRWQDGNFGPLYVARNPGYYTVQVFNQCGIADDSINLILSAHCIVSILVPTAFSPNGDGVNDVFRPVVRHQIYNYELRIFNRWGQLVFLSNNPEQGWDGTFHGTPCEVGGYAWWIKYSQVQNGPPVFKKGVLTLVR